MQDTRKWIDFLFEDAESGERFLVELEQDDRTMDELIDDAQTIADENFKAPEFIDIVSEEEAEVWGLDTY